MNKNCIKLRLKSYDFPNHSAVRVDSGPGTGVPPIRRAQEPACNSICIVDDASHRLKSARKHSGGSHFHLFCACIECDETDETMSQAHRNKQSSEALNLQETKLMNYS